MAPRSGSETVLGQLTEYYTDANRNPFERTYTLRAKPDTEKPEIVGWLVGWLAG